MTRINYVLLLICMFSGWAVSQSVPKKTFLPGQPRDGRADVQTEPPEDFTIGPEDVLSITVWHEPDLTNRVTVRPDGKIGIPLLNDVQASGLTPKRLQEQITEGLKTPGLGSRSGNPQPDRLRHGRCGPARRLSAWTANDCDGASGPVRWPHRVCEI